MMLLGVVFHAALPYRTMNGQELEGQAFAYAVNTNVFFDRLTIAIHAFRMPVFFVMAGFFGALLYYQRGSLYMIRNRINRMVWPLAASLLTVLPLTMLLASFRNHSEVSWTEGLIALKTRLANLDFFYPFRTLHLWFLYYLSLITLVVWLLALLMDKSPAFKKSLQKNFERMVRPAWLRLILFSFFTLIIFYFMGRSFLVTPPDFRVNVPVLIMYLQFYLFGWLLFKAKDLLPAFIRYDWAHIVAGTLLLLIYGWTVSNQIVREEIQMALKALTIWLFISGLTGLFQRYFSTHSSTIRYLADASYWIYIIHLPVATLFHGVLAPLTLSVFLKFGIVFIATSVICLLSYQYGVRSTIVGKFLNAGYIRERRRDAKTIAVK